MKPTQEDVVRPGMVVSGYRIEKKLGAGGFGKVYLVWRGDGSPCALKFIHLKSVGEWGWRELFIMLRHEFPHVVKLLSHFKWPEDKPEYLVLVMEYVPGVTLYQWARDNNPCARELVEKLLPLSRALKAVHTEDVFHRDLKGDNVLVRETDGAPVLVDFGAGAMPGAPRVTRGSLAPANLRYRSPESVAFFLREDRKQGERYDYAETDELYALGVILYVLATDVYPFGGPDDELMGEILAGNPKPPHVRNSRVPRALSELCLHLLAREPHARVPDLGSGPGGRQPRGTDGADSMGPGAHPAGEGGALRGRVGRDGDRGPRHLHAQAMVGESRDWRRDSRWRDVPINGGLEGFPQLRESPLAASSHSSAPASPLLGAQHSHPPHLLGGTGLDDCHCRGPRQSLAVAPTVQRPKEKGPEPTGGSRPLQWTLLHAGERHAQGRRVVFEGTDTCLVSDPCAVPVDRCVAIHGPVD